MNTSHVIYVMSLAGLQLDPDSVPAQDVRKILSDATEAVAELIIAAKAVQRVNDAGRRARAPRERLRAALLRCEGLQ